MEATSAPTRRYPQYKMKWLLAFLVSLLTTQAIAQIACTSTLSQTGVLLSFADNTTGAITPRNLRDYVCSITAGSVLFGAANTTSLTVTGGSSLFTLTTSGSANLNNTLTVSGASVLGSLTATGATSLATVTTAGISASALTVTGNTSVNAINTGNIVTTGNVNATSVYIANGTIGVTCATSTATLSTFTVTNGIVTHC